MKKLTQLIINILLLTGLIITVVTVAFIGKELHDFIQDKSSYQAELSYTQAYHPEYGQNVWNFYLDKISALDKLINKYAIWLTLHLIAAIASLSALCIIDIPIIKNYVSMTTKQRAQSKTERAQLKADRAEAEKQKRIAELRSELDELKKDE